MENNIEKIPEFKTGLYFYYKPEFREQKFESIDGNLWQRIVLVIPSVLINTVNIIKCVAGAIFAVCTLKLGKSKAYCYCIVRHAERVIGSIVQIFFKQWGKNLLIDSRGHLLLYCQYINKYEDIVVKAEIFELIKSADSLCKNYDLPSVIKSFSNIFKKQNREISIHLLKKCITDTENMGDSFNKEIALYFDLLLELGGDKGLEDELVKKKLNAYHVFYGKKFVENTDVKHEDYNSILEKIGSIFNPFKNLAKAILEKEIEIIAKAFENTIFIDEKKHVTIQDSVIDSRLKNESINDVKKNNQQLFYALRKPLLKYYLIDHFSLPQEKKEEYKFDDQLVLELSPSKCKLFEILLEFVGDEEQRWVGIKLTQIKKYMDKESIDLERYCEGCPLLKKALINCSN